LRSSCTIVGDSDKDMTCVAVAPNDALVATGSLDKCIRLWSVSTASGGQLVLTAAATLDGNRRGVWALAFSPVDQLLASAGGDACVRLFSLGTAGNAPSCVLVLDGHAAAVTCVTFTGDGQRLLSTDGGGLLKLWSVRERNCVRTYEAHSAKIWALAVENETGTVLTGGADATALLWADVSDAEREREEEQRHTREVHRQQLDNLLANKRYADALHLALTLGRPAAALRTVRALVNIEKVCTDAQDNGVDDLSRAVRALSLVDVSTLLEYVVQWNTNTQTASVSARAGAHQ
jgi:U3 small nucleolar RNA-associated protein 13